MGGALTHNSMHSAVCFAIVSGHAGGGRSSTAQYHPLSTRYVSLRALLLRWLSTMDAASVVCCVQSAAREAFILQPIQRVAVRGRFPILLSVACWSITFQVLSKIHRLAGRSLLGGGDYVKA
jgi:hypothetical protein